MNTHEVKAVELDLCAEVARLLEIPTGDVQADWSLGELGLDSLGFVELSRFIGQRYDVSLPPDALYAHSTIRFTAQWLTSEHAGTTESSTKHIGLTAKRADRQDIGIVGVNFRLPGASQWHELDSLLDRTSNFCSVPATRWPHQRSTAYPDTLRVGALDDVARFDAAFFRISPREAVAMDPQQRLLLESAWHALEDAGLSPEQWDGTRTSVFVGASSFDYAELLKRTGTGRASHIGTGLSHAILANRLSQYFNFRGSSETLDTACSSSMVALWRAVRELRHGEADMALVAGVNVFASETPFNAFSEAGMLNPDGASLPFDENAAGYVRGEGVVTLVLKPLHVAQQHGDTLLGVIRGGAVRHSGRTQSLTAPSPTAQAEVVQAALDDAGVSPDAIGYIEAHGTGTSLGDPIELRGLCKVFENQVESVTPFNRCRIGSIKAQIGHLEAAAGLAGVVKVLHCFRQRRLPGNPQIKQLNPLIDLKSSRLCIERESADWKHPADDSSDGRLAGVSSFGFGGTNAHMILEEPPKTLTRAEWQPPRKTFAGAHYWPALDSSQLGDDRLDCRQIRWVAENVKPIPNTGKTKPETVWIVVNGQRGRSVAAALANQKPEWLWIQKRWPEFVPENGGSEAEPTVWIDLSALDSGSDVSSENSVAHLDIIARCLGPMFKRGSALRLVQVTSQLRDLAQWDYPTRSLAGAVMNGWYDSVSAEYRNCQSKSVDFVDADCSAETMSTVLLEELAHPFTDQAIAYVDQQRLIPQWESVALTQQESQSVADGVVLVTGGLGDIGRYLVTDLVNRAVKAVLLTGRADLSAEAEQQVRQWQANGVTVSYLKSALTDTETLYPALDDFRQQFGDFSHVFHCAGYVDDKTIAFYKKDHASMAPVFEPKVDALDVMHRYFVNHPPKHIVLFSSVSAADPDKAIGILDYAAANRYLDHYAAFRNQQGLAIYQSIQWGLWASTSMSSKTIPGQNSGVALSADTALSALFRILGSGDHSASVRVESNVAAPLMQARAEPESSVREISLPEQPNADEITASSLLPQLRQLIATELETSEAALDDNASFDELGVDSIVLMDVITAIERWISRTVDPAALIRCDSIAATANYLAELGVSASTVVDTTSSADTEETLQIPNNRISADSSFKVAVIGMACQMPGAPDVLSFWNNLEAGVDSVTTMPADQRRDQPVGANVFPRWAGLIDGFDELYPQLYNFPTDAAADIDPLVRLFTECGLLAIHNSSVGIDAVQGERVGIFSGARTGRYSERIVQPGARSITGIGQNFIAAYLSHVLDLRGPNLVVDTACSSSLSAIHLACNSMRTGDCEMAVAGGVDLILDQRTHEYLGSARALSPDGRCRPFSANANGFVPGEGVGAVVLKPLDRAIAEGDTIYAVINGSAINNDGHTLGITTPGSGGQTDVIGRALANSQIASSDISYVEAHGTGTMIGDPIELQSLARAYHDDPPLRCGVGSVKSNVGHLLSAAGIASFIKVVLSLHHRTLPPTLHCEQINPRIGFDQLPFYPVLETQPWASGRAGRIAGISAFGFGKTNVHLIVSERPESVPEPELLCRPLPASFSGERIRAWHDTQPVPVHEFVKKRALLSVGDVLVEEL